MGNFNISAYNIPAKNESSQGNTTQSGIALYGQLSDSSIFGVGGGLLNAENLFGCQSDDGGPAQ